MLKSTVLSVLLFHGDPGCHLVEKRELSAAVSGISCLTRISRSLSFFKVLISLSLLCLAQNCGFPSFSVLLKVVISLSFFLPHLMFLFPGASPVVDGVANHAWKTSNMALVITLLGPGMENT